MFIVTTMRQRMKMKPFELKGIDVAPYIKGRARGLKKQQGCEKLWFTTELYDRRVKPCVSKLTQINRIVEHLQDRINGEQFAEIEFKIDEGIPTHEWMCKCSKIDFGEGLFILFEEIA